MKLDKGDSGSSNAYGLLSGSLVVVSVGSSEIPLLLIG